VLAGLGAGYWLDGRLGTEPWFLLVGGTLGVGAALLYFFRAVSSLSKRRADQKR
jgi:F0F1-type ATP synthase assembly protein I